MKNSPILRAALIGIIAILALALLRFQPWKHASGPKLSAAMAQRPVLTVGFLPVTCHLTCPVTDYASRTSGAYRYESERFTDWPTIAEAFKAGRLDATFLLAPLAMKMVETGTACKIVYLGHRDGSTLMVAKDSTAKSLLDLQGKNFAVPNFVSNQYLVIRRKMDQLGMAPNSIHFVQMAPPDMPTALQTHAIDAYFVGEPFAAKAQMGGYGRVLYYAKDLWPGFISCVLVVSDRLIKEHPEEVHDLVRGIADSGDWADKNRVEAASVAAPFFRQDPKLLKFVLTEPPDRVSYSMLTPTDKDMEDIEDEALKTGLLKTRIPLSSYLDRSFIPKNIVPAIIPPPAKS